MKVMSVGLISLIIFNIVSAANTSDSGPTKNSSLLLEEKTKKNHKTIEESVNVKGKRPYEGNYGDMVKDIYMSLEDSYQYSQNNSHEQDDAPPPVYKGPKKREFTEKRQLRTINENNEISRKPKELLRTDPKKDTKTTEKTKEKKKPKSLVRYSTSNEVYNNHKHLLCTNPKEIKQAEELMDEAVEHLKYHITVKGGYEYDSKIYLKDIIFCKKIHEGQNVVKGLYISEDQTIIVMTSANINDGHPSKEEFKNKIIENANLFKTQINSEDDIRNGQLEKEFLNIGGYLIKKISEHVRITHIKSVRDIQILTT
ncbi:fam-a protein [Plasmodium vinckei brucechwatti]|uniref:Fam-a protein n=1 Tax=Plasmodium vinckei brucechwatti TaxID=119398 RepID=A0A6V7S5L9_PLAVN|nr:fam-a protein [Plasmodium vinckei brucechwatti]